MSNLECGMTITFGKRDLMRILNHKLTIAFVIGVCLGIVYLTIPQNGTARTQLLLFELILFPLAVLIVSHPLDNYRHSIAIAAVAVLACTAVKFISAVLTIRHFWTNEFALMFLSFYSFASLVVNVTLVSVATFLRRWLYPIHPVGHCQTCGYNLTGNTSGTCPECGTIIKK